MARRGRAAKISSRMGRGRKGGKTVLSSPYQHVLADIHRSKRGGRGKRY